MSQSIELYEKISNPIDAIDKLGQWFANSGMFGCDRPEQGKVLAFACLAEKKTPFSIVRTYHLIQGRLSMRADAMLAEFKRLGGKYKILSRTAEKAVIELVLDGQTQKFSFDWEEAQKEPFVRDSRGGFKTNWATPRARMQSLWARVISDGVHAMAPEIVAGVMTPEEAVDDPPELKPLLTQPVQQPPAQPQPEKPIDVPAKKVETPAEPAQTAKPATPFRAEPGENGYGINDKTVIELIKVIGMDNEHVALKWMESHGWIVSMGGLKDLKASRAQMILDNPEKFLKHAKAQPAQQPA